MEESVLRAWESFYVIVGSSAGALTGLQFVVLTLISESGKIRGTQDTMSAFASPNVVHFCAALLVSAIASAPWLGLRSPGVALGMCGVLGFAYSLTVLQRARRQKDYKPVLEDWIWHTALPLVAYAGLFIAGLAVPSFPGSLYVIGGATLLLVFVGIHNAWDTVMYVMVSRDRDERATRERTVAAKADERGQGPATPPAVADPTGDPS